MKKTKKICYKLLALILVCVITCSVNSAEVVHAAGISKDRADVCLCIKKMAGTGSVCYS